MHQPIIAALGDGCAKLSSRWNLSRKARNDEGTEALETRPGLGGDTAPFRQAVGFGYC